MRAFHVLILCAAFGLAASAAQAAQTIGYSPAAQRVLAQARQAAGGSGWNLLRGWHETGHSDGVRYEAWIDPLRYGLRVERQRRHPRCNSRAQGDRVFLGLGLDLKERIDSCLAAAKKH